LYFSTLGVFVTKTSFLKLSLAATLLIGFGPLGCTKTRDSGPMVEVPAGTFVEGWRADLDLRRNKVTAIDVVGDQVLVRTRSNMVYGLSADGGTLKWSSQVLAPDRTLGKPELIGDKIVFPTYSELIVYNQSGRREKEIDVNRSVRSPISGDGEFVYLGVDYNAQGRLGRVSLTAPYVPVRWELMTRGPVTAAPAVFQGVIYAGSEDGNVYAVTEERLAIWSLPGNVFSTGGPIRADIQVDDTGVYVASTDGKLYALDRVTGKIKWQYFAGTPLLVPPALTSDVVYQYVPRRGVVAIDKLTGSMAREPKWTAEYAMGFITADANHAYLRGGDGEVVAVDKATGKAAIKSQSDQLEFTAGRGGMIYAATEEGVILGVKTVKTGGVVGKIVAVPVRDEDLLRAVGG
jgi:outer membrane protein assembly factor BamB